MSQEQDLRARIVVMEGQLVSALAAQKPAEANMVVLVEALKEMRKIAYAALHHDVLALAEAAKRGREDTARMDWLETQDCWIGVSGEYDVTPKFAVGGGYALTVRETIDRVLRSVIEEGK
jgi:hypothetical protein